MRPIRARRKNPEKKYKQTRCRTKPDLSPQNIVRAARVPQPPDQSSNAGHRVAAANRGGVSLITFFGRTKKVIGVRGRTPRLCFCSVALFSFMQNNEQQIPKE
jgi:hypothetical protein